MIFNASDDTLAVKSYLSIGSWYQDSGVVVVPAHAFATAHFTPLILPSGLHQVVFSVWVEGDECPKNDTSRACAFTLSQYWTTLHTTPCSRFLTSDGPGNEVYGLDLDGPTLADYSIVGDSWETRSPSPASGGHIALCRAGSALYAIGSVPPPPRGLGRGRSSIAQSSYVLLRYRTAADAWDTVTFNLPVSVGPGCGLAASDSNNLFLLADGDSTNLRRYDVSKDSWYDLSAMPGSVGTWSGVASDGSTIYVLNGSGCDLHGYKVSADSWFTLMALNQWGSGALAFDPLRNCLYALVGFGTGGQFSRYDLTKSLSVNNP
jgi:hypothetical protein